MEELDFLKTEEEFDALVELQEFMMSLTLSNLEESELMIIQSDWVLTKKAVKQLVLALLLTAKYRPQSIPAVVEMIKFLISQSSDDNKLFHFKRTLLLSIFRNLYYKKPFPTESSNVCLLYECFTAKIFSVEEIIQRINIFSKESTEYMRSMCWLFCYFAPEILTKDKELYTRLFKVLKKGAKMRQFPQVFKKFRTDIKEMKANKWKKVKNGRNKLKHQFTYEARIARDDLDALRELAAYPTFNVDQRIVPSIYGSCAFLQAHPTILQVAAFYGSIQCFRYLALNGADMGAVDRNFITVPQFAVAGGNLEIIRMCEQYNLDFEGTIHIAALFHRFDVLQWLYSTKYHDLNALDFSGMNVLHRSTESANLHAMDLCLKNGVSVDIRTFDGWTPLRIAVRRGHLDATRFILAQKNVDINVRTQQGVAPVHLAAKYGDIASLKLLVKKGGLIIDEPSDRGLTPFLLAVLNGHLLVVRYLLQIPEVDIMKRTHEDGTALHLAIYSNFKQIAIALLEDSRTDPNALMSNSFSTIYMAARYDRTEIFQQLIKYNVNVNSIGPDDISVLQFAAKNGNNTMLQLLVNHPDIDVNLTSKNGTTALHRACAHGHVEAVKILLTHKHILVNLQTYKGNTALHFACLFDTVEIAYILLERKELNINIVGEEIGTALHAACERNNEAFVCALMIRDDLDVNLKNPDGLTALMIAARNNNAQIVQILLTRNDLEYDARSDDGITAYEYALRYKAVDVLPYLNPEVLMQENKFNDKKQQKSMFRLFRK